MSVSAAEDLAVDTELLPVESRDILRGFLICYINIYFIFTKKKIMKKVISFYIFRMIYGIGFLKNLLF